MRREGRSNEACLSKAKAHMAKRGTCRKSTQAGATRRFIAGRSSGRTWKIQEQTTSTGARAQTLVNTTWEDQCKLAEVLREMGVTCKACLHCHKSHDSGRTCYKDKVSAGSVTSTGRTCDSACDLRRGRDAATSMTADHGRAKEPGVTMGTGGTLDLSRNM